MTDKANLQEKLKLIRDFCNRNSDQQNIEKYSRYFKEEYNGYGIGQAAFEGQRDKWIEEWKTDMTLNDYLDLGDELVKCGKYEEISFAIVFVKSQRDNYNEDTFNRIGKWFDYGIDNWANTDVLCMLVLPHFIINEVIDYKKFGTWIDSNSEWKRRTVPVTLNELLKHHGVDSNVIFELIDPLMLDKSQYVQKGIGTLLRSLWKKEPGITEDFLLKWKDQCGRLIVQYATEKMDKEYRKKFRKVK